MPESPKQEATLLPCPEAGYYIVRRQISRRVLPDIIILKLVSIDEPKEYDKNT
jgi:hypothetical protein